MEKSIADMAARIKRQEEAIVAVEVARQAKLHAEKEAV